jgi:hypothetical protein
MPVEQLTSLRLRPAGSATPALDEIPTVRERSCKIYSRGLVPPLKATGFVERNQSP